MKFAGRIIFLLVGLTVVVMGVALSLPVSRPASPSRIIASSNLKLREIWRRSINVTYGGLPLAVTKDDKLIVPIVTSNKTSLSALDVRTGQTIWSTKLASQHRPDGQLMDSLLINTDRIYVALPFEVQAFQALDGAKLWATTELAGHTSYDILPVIQNGLLSVVGNQQYTIRIQDGVIQSVGVYANDANSERDLIDSHTRIVHPIGVRLLALTAVDASSGKFLWRTATDKITSNFVILDQNLYAISADAVLWAYNIATGQETGHITFAGNPLDVDHASQYWLATDGTRLFVYLGDSQDLIAFEHK